MPRLVLLCTKCLFLSTEDSFSNNYTEQWSCPKCEMDESGITSSLSEMQAEFMDRVARAAR